MNASLPKSGVACVDFTDQAPGSVLGAGRTVARRGLEHLPLPVERARFHPGARAAVPDLGRGHEGQRLGFGGPATGLVVDIGCEKNHRHIRRTPQERGGFDAVQVTVEANVHDGEFQFKR